MQVIARRVFSRVPKTTIRGLGTGWIEDLFDYTNRRGVVVELADDSSKTMLVRWPCMLHVPPCCLLCPVVFIYFWSPVLRGNSTGKVYQAFAWTSKLAFGSRCVGTLENFRKRNRLVRPHLHWFIPFIVCLCHCAIVATWYCSTYTWSLRVVMQCCTGPWPHWRTPTTDALRSSPQSSVSSSILHLEWS